jgi:hypothetical protein
LVSPVVEMARSPDGNPGFSLEGMRLKLLLR